LRQIDGLTPRLVMGLACASESFPLRSAARAMADHLRRELSATAG